MYNLTILNALRTGAAITPLKNHTPDLEWVLMKRMTSLYGPIRPMGSSRTHFVAIESPRRNPPLARYAGDLIERGIRQMANGQLRHPSDLAVPVPNVAALCAGRSMAHAVGGSTENVRLRENGAALCRAALQEAEACVAAAGRARKEETRAACAEHARVALEAARYVADEFELGAAVVVPAFSVLAPHLWALVAPAYTREAAMVGGPVQLPDDDADALGCLV